MEGERGEGGRERRGDGLLLMKIRAAQETLAQKPKFFIFPDWSYGQPGKIITSFFRAHRLRVWHAYMAGRRHAGLPSAAQFNWGVEQQRRPGQANARPCRSEGYNATLATMALGP